MASAVRALIFDCDGVLADTERYGHLPAFNQTFRDFGLPVQWSEEEYGRRLLIGGGKERMASLLTPDFVAAAGLPTDAEGQRAEVARWHAHKTAIYTDMVASGAIAARPGIARIIGEALGAGWLLAVASTSAEPSVRAILDHVAGADAARFSAILAGDVVAHKKPAPDIYLLALERLGVSRARRRGHRGFGQWRGSGRSGRPDLCRDRQRLHPRRSLPGRGAGGGLAGRPRACHRWRCWPTAAPRDRVPFVTLDDLAACLPQLMPA